MELTKLIFQGALFLARKINMPKLVGPAPQPDAATAERLNAQALRSI